VYLRGWSRYLTLYSAEANMRMDGTPRIRLNNPDLTQLSEELAAVFDESWTNFILAYRIYGPSTSQGGGGQSSQEQSSGGGSGEGGSGDQDSGDSGGRGDQGNSGGGSGQGGGDQGGGGQGGGGQSGGGQSGGGQGGNSPPPLVVDPADLELDLTQQPRGTFVQVLDLIGKQVQFSANGRQLIVRSPFVDDVAEMANYLPLLMEHCTASDADVIPGRINVNEAPPEILLGIPGMREEIVDAILSTRGTELDTGDPGRQYETWLLAEGIVTVDEMRALTPFINAGGDVFRAQVVGYFQGGGPSSRAEVVFDATAPLPRLLFWRDISHLGRGYPLDMLGLELTATP
jgi:hypothetical protein